MTCLKDKSCQFSPSPNLLPTGCVALGQAFGYLPLYCVRYCKDNIKLSLSSANEARKRFLRDLVGDEPGIDPGGTDVPFEIVRKRSSPAFSEYYGAQCMKSLKIIQCNAVLFQLLFDRPNFRPFEHADHPQIAGY